MVPAFPVEMSSTAVQAVIYVVTFMAAIWSFLFATR